MNHDLVRQHVLSALSAMATGEHVTLLYACEAGSRAWGIESEHSDYDVRFLYVRPKDAYLRLDAPRDVIERPMSDDLDISGWDIFKALRLFRKSNPPLLEWLFSPVVYLEQSRFTSPLRTLAETAYSQQAIFYHYRHMAQGNYRQYIEHKTIVPTKKYLYVIRPLVALLYLEQHQCFPPTHFPKTLAQVELAPMVREHITALLARKQAGEELGTGACDRVLNQWIDERLSRWEAPVTMQPPQHRALLTASLDTVLSNILASVEGR